MIFSDGTIEAETEEGAVPLRLDGRFQGLYRRPQRG